MLKWIALLVLGGAVIAAAVAGVSIANARESEALAKLRAAESAEEAAKAAARQAQSEEKAAAANESAAQAAQRTAEENRRTKEAERDIAREESAKARADGEAAKQLKAAREAEAAAAADQKAIEKARADVALAEAEKAKAEADAEIAKAQAEADRLAREKLASEAVVAEAKLWELKALDLATLERELNDYKRELDERELALRPEKTIKDLVNIGEESAADPSADGSALLPENDPDLPKADRRLAKVLRENAEGMERMVQRNREITVGKLEPLYVAAVRDGRTTDAEFYRQTLKTLYPDWEYKPPKQEQEEEKQ